LGVEEATKAAASVARAATLGEPTSHPTASIPIVEAIHTIVEAMRIARAEDRVAGRAV